MNDILPNAFLLGLPKCGTTSLVSMLDAHPDITTSRPKEPCIFGLDDPRLNPHPFFESPDSMLSAIEASTYETLMLEHAQKAFHNTTSAIRLDGTPGYLVSNVARQRIKNHVANARFIIVLRDPTRRLVSVYWHLVRHGRVGMTFHRWVRKEGMHPLQTGMYKEHLESWLTDFDNHQFFITTTSRLKSEPEEVLQNAYRHLNVDGRLGAATPSRTVIANVTPYPRFIAPRLTVNALSQHFSSARHATSIFSDKRPKPDFREKRDRYIHAALHRTGRLLESNATSAPAFRGRDKEMLNYIRRLYSARNRGLNALVGWDIESEWF